MKSPHREEKKIPVMKILLVFAFCAAVCTIVCGYQEREGKGIGINPGPVVIATKGGVWPLPREQKYFPGVMGVRPNEFKFKIVGKSCDIVEDAMVRYAKIIKMQERKTRMMKSGQNDAKRRDLTPYSDFAGYLNELKINLKSPCETLPYFNMDEKYELRVNTPDLPKDGLLTASSVWGILRGLETFSQLLYMGNGSLVFNSTAIMDFPRFSHRGLLLDTSRHYMPMYIIYKMLDAMAMNKLNVFHWHVVDDHSFPYESITYPNLSKYGAYTPKHVYTQENVKEILKYATYRGIRVVVEFDSPGHTRSWGQAYPEILTKCYKNNAPDGSLGPMNPISQATYDFMNGLLDEVKRVFPDNYTHLGGDEVEYACWQSNPDLINYTKNNSITFTQLEELYVKKIIDMATRKSFKSVVWQEVFDNGLNVPKDTIIHVWKVNNYRGEMARVTEMGYKMLLSSPWYLDHLNTGGDWIKYYNADPLDFPGTAEQKNLVIGGEACMWSEVVDATNVMQRVWPRASAVAEKLWSTNKNYQAAAKRLEEHACRLNMRGIPAQPPNGPGFCQFVNF